MVDLSNDIQSIVFRLGNEEYGIDIHKVQEIIRLPEITRLPDMVNHVLGIINLRGNIIPLVDLKIKLMAVGAEYSETTRVLVVEVGSTKVGFIVDEVSEVICIPGNMIVEADEIGGSISSEYLLGVAKMNNRLLIILNIDEILR